MAKMIFKDSFFIEQDKKSWAKRMDDTLIIRTGKTIHDVNLFIEELINGKEVNMETECYALAAFDFFWNRQGVMLWIGQNAILVE